MSSPSWSCFQHYNVGLDSIGSPSNGKSRETRKSNAFGWHKPRLRGRISTQACLVRRFTLSQEFNRNTSLSCCITLWDQRKLHHLCGPAGVRYCICLLFRGHAYCITALVWTPLDLQVMAKAVKQGGPMTFGWHKPRLRGRISTQACLVRRFTLSDKSSTGTQACPAASRYGTSASCITYADQWGCDPAL